MPVTIAVTKTKTSIRPLASDGSGQVYVWEMVGQQVPAEGAVAHAPVTSDWHIFSDLNFI